jgi:hypothetical protein
MNARVVEHVIVALLRHSTNCEAVYGEWASSCPAPNA